MVRNVTRGLSQEGIETHVATTDDNGPETLQVPCGVPVVQEGVTYWYFHRQMRPYTFSWPLAVWLARHVSEFDVLHIHALFSFATLPAAFWARRRGVPYIVRPLGTLNEWGMKNRRPRLKKLSFRLLERRVLAHAALVHYTSDQERLEAEKLQVTAAAAVIPNAVPDSSGVSVAGRFRAAHPQLKGRRLILFLSRIDAKKGLDLLLRAFATVRQQVPGAALVVAGDGQAGFVSGLKVEAASLGIASDVHWVGFLADEEKQSTLADAELFVLPSYSENFGIAVVEAMAAGVPVIVSDQVGIHREIAQAQAGLVVSCHEAELASALVQLLHDPTLGRSMGENGKSLARRHYSSDALTHRLIGLYNEIALPPEPPRTSCPLSVVILTLNEETNLPVCLASVGDWVQQVFVVDAGSSDRTREIAEESGAVVVEHPFETHAAQWRWALENLPIRTDWILALDADQRVTPQLAHELCHLDPAALDGVDGLYINRRQCFRDHWIRHGGYYPKYLLKMFRRGKVVIDPADLVDHHFYIPGPVKKLHHDLIEANKKEDDISFWIEKHNRYATLLAREEFHWRRTLRETAIEPSLIGSPDQKSLALKHLWRRMPLYVRPFLYFVYRYFFRGGFLDGKEGAIFHFLQAFWFRLLVDIKLDEMQRESSHS